MERMVAFLKRRRIPLAIGVALAPFILVWAFWFGGAWSIADRVRGTEHPLPWPGARLARPEWASSYWPDEVGTAYIRRVRPGTVYYYHHSRLLTELGMAPPSSWFVLTHAVPEDIFDWDRIVHGFR